MTAMRAHFLVALAIALPSVASATDLGQVGRSWKIAEPDFEEVIKKRLSKMEESGELAIHQKEIQDRARAAIERPTPVDGLARVQRDQHRYFDPSVVLTRNLEDGLGNLISPQGTVVNPLEYISLPAPILMIDGDDLRQMDLAAAKIKKDSRTIVILVKGSFLAATKELNHKVWFDQQAQFTQRFGIAAVPSLITQDGMRLRIDEIAP